MRDKLRIGIVTGEYPPMQGGVGAYTRILALKYTDYGHQVFIYSDHRAEEPDPRIHITNSVHKWSRGAVSHINRWAREHQLDLISLQFETAAFGMSAWIHFLPGIVSHIPVVTTFHDLLVPYLFPKAGKLREWIVLRLAKNSAGAIVTNHEDFKQIEYLETTTLIPIGSNIPDHLPADYDRDDWRASAGASPDDFLLAYFGFLNRSKGVEILLQDMAELIAAGYPFRLVMIGGRTGTSDSTNAEYLAEIEELIEALNLAPYIHWTDFVEDDAVSAYLAASDAVVMPFRDGASYRRGSLMAALQHGCAIITTRPNVNIPLFADGENMLIARPQILSEDCPPYLHLSAQLLKLYRDPELRRTLQIGARKLAEAFNWDAIAADTLFYFDEILDQHAKKGQPH